MISEPIREALLDGLEQKWRPYLEAVSLVAEVLDRTAASDRDEGLEALGRLYSLLGRRPSALRRWPATHLIVTAGVAADHYEMGTFWPKLTSRLGLRNDQALHRDWGDAFLANLQRIRLPTFDEGEAEAGTKYVGRILIHCGMPTYCLADFFELLVRRRDRMPGLTPEDLIRWAVSRVATSSLSTVDVPVRRFLRHGEVFAADVVGRSFELLDVVARGGSTEAVPLPRRFQEAALRFHRQRGASPYRQNARSAADSVHPQLVLAPDGRGPMLRLPPVGEAPDGRAVWLLDLDGTPQRIPTQALWPGANEPVPQTDVPLRGPVRTIGIALADRPDLQLQIPVVDADDPLLAFNEDGIALPNGLPFPDRPTWLLYPGEVESLTFGGDAPLITEAMLPPGWDGWFLKLVDLERASSVAVGGVSHPVRSYAAARISTNSAVPGVRTSAGLPVISRIPTIQLPEHLDEAPWEVTLTGQDGTVVSRWKRGDTPSDPDSAWAHVPRPALGTFTIRVRGPWGRGATRSVTIVEGLAVTSVPSWRWLVPEGLQPVEVRITAHGGVALSRRSLSLAARQRDSFVEVSAHGAWLMLEVAPPHMTVSYLSGEAMIRPVPAAVQLIREDVLAEPGALIIDIGSAAEPHLHLQAKTEIVQTIRPSSGRGGLYRFDLGALVDTLAAYPKTDLFLDQNGMVPVASIRPRALYGEIIRDHDHLQFSDCAEVDGLHALLFATRAPWRQPEVVAIKDGTALLADWMVDAGPLLVLARIEDPWAPLPLPVWPEFGEAELADGPGWLIDGDPEEQAVSAFLAGLRPLPEMITDHGRLWTVRGLIGRLCLGSRVGEASVAVDAALQADPRPALLALSGSQAPTDEIPSLLIRTGIVWADLSTAHEDEPPTWSVRGALPAALLSAADAAWSAEEVEAASEVCGAVVAQLLRGIDPFARDGRLDDAAVVLAQHPERRDQIVRQLGLVPKGLLSGDTRVMAAMDLVRDREDSRLSWLKANAHRVLAQTMEAVRLLNDPLATVSFAARRPLEASGGWRALPGISLGLAFAARHAARGNEAMRRWIPRQRRCWADLAEVAPQMVTIDLILAELLVAGSHDRLEGRAT